MIGMRILPFRGTTQYGFPGSRSTIPILYPVVPPVLTLLALYIARSAEPTHLLLLYHHSWHLSRTFRPFLVIQNIKPQHVVVVGNEAPKKAKSVSPCETTTYANSAPGEFLENADKLNHNMLWFRSTKTSQMSQKRLKPRVGCPKGTFSREYLAKSPSFVSPCETMTYANSAPGNFC